MAISNIFVILYSMIKQREEQTIISASEVAEYVFCAKAWRLKRDGAVPQGPQLETGVIFHEKQRAQISRSVIFYRAALFFGLIAIILLVTWVLFRQVLMRI